MPPIIAFILDNVNKLPFLFMTAVLIILCLGIVGYIGALIYHIFNKELSA